MTQPLRDTKYARGLATARLPSGPGGTSSAAIERIFVKQTEQIEVRFSWWEGSRMMPRSGAGGRIRGTCSRPAEALDRRRLRG